MGLLMAPIYLIRFDPVEPIGEDGLAAPGREVFEGAEGQREIVARIESRLLGGYSDDAPSTTMSAMAAALGEAAKAGKTAADCLGAGLSAAREAPFSSDAAGMARAAGSGVNTPFTPLPDDGLEPHCSSGEDPSDPADPVDDRLFSAFLNIEINCGVVRPLARRSALAALAERDRARIDRPLPGPLAISSEELRQVIQQLIGLITFGAGSAS